MGKIRWAMLALVFAGVAAGASDDATDEAPGRSASRIESSWSELIQEPTTTAAQQQRDRFASFAEALANESYAEAEVAAKQLVEGVDADTVDAPAERARGLHNLAVAQQLLGSLDSAIQNYSAALDVINSDADKLNPSMILPLRGLALAHLDVENPGEAIAAYERALHINSVNYGPHSLQQLPILNSQMQLYFDQSDPKSALDVLDRIHGLYRREFPPASPELLPMYRQRAELYTQLKMYAEAHNAWRHVLRIRQKHLGKQHLALIEPHLRLAEIGMRKMRTSAYRLVTTSTPELHLKKALSIAENSPQENWEVRKDCLLSLADFYTLFDMKGRARRYYKAAWELMSSSEEYRLTRAADLEVPVPLARPRPHPYANFEYDRKRGEVHPDDYLEGEIVMSFTVNDRGRTDDLQVVEADPAKFSQMEKRVQNAVEEFIYRPRFVDGRPAPTPNLEYRMRYYYLPAEYQASLDKSARRGPR